MTFDLKTEIPKIVIQLFNTFEENNIRYCHFKSNQHLKEGLVGETDLDILIDKSKHHESEIIFNQLKFKRVISQPWAKYPGVEDWIGFDYESGELIHIHLHYQLITGFRFVKEYRIPIEEQLLNSSIKSDSYGVYTADPNLELILLFIRVSLKTSKRQMFKRNPLPNNIIDEIMYLNNLVEKEKIDFFSKKIFGDKYSQLISDIIDSNTINNVSNIKKMKEIVSKIYKETKRKNIFNKIIQHYFYKFKWGLSRVAYKKNYLIRHGKRLSSGGVTIAFIGCDGSGKSTITKEIKEWLSWKLDVHKIYLGSGDGAGGLINLFKLGWKTSKRTKIISEKQINSHKTDRKRSKLISFAEGVYAIILARVRYKKIKKSKALTINGSIVLSDRFPQDQYFGINDGPLIKESNNKLIKFLLKVEENYFNKFKNLHPDVIIKLDIDGEIAHQRKPSENKDLVIKKANIVRNLKYVNSKEIKIDASQSLNKVIIEVKQNIWELL